MSTRARLIAAVSFACLIAVALGGANVAGATTAGEVTTLKVGSKPCGGQAIAPAAEGGVLLRECGKRSNAIAWVDPDGTVKRLAEVGSEGGPVLEGPAGEIWAAGNAEGAARVDRIAPGGRVRQVKLGNWKSGEVRARGLVITADGSLWVALAREAFSGYASTYDTLGGELVRISRRGKVAHFRIPGGLSPGALALGPDGNLWFTGVSGRYDTEHGGFSPGTGYVGRMTPGGRFATFKVGEGTSPGPIAAGPDGNLWLTEGGPPQELVSIGTDGSFGAAVPLPAGAPESPGGSLQSAQGSLLFGPEADAWIVDSSGLTRVTPSGQATLFPEVRGKVAAFGTEGNLWVDGASGLHRLVLGDPRSAPTP